MRTSIISGPEFVTEALFGIGLSYGITSDIKNVHQLKDTPEYDRLMNVARGLAHKQGGHNKFLETIMFTLDVRAPRYWWQEFDAYRVGITKQSESTMHTIMARELTKDDFEGAVFDDTLERLNALRRNYFITKEREGSDSYGAHREFMFMKALLPEGFLQRRIVAVNAKALQNVYLQRRNHRLPEWGQFFGSIHETLTECGAVEKESDLALYCIFGEDGK